MATKTGHGLVTVYIGYIQRRLSQVVWPASTGHTYVTVSTAARLHCLCHQLDIIYITIVAFIKGCLKFK